MRKEFLAFGSPRIEEPEIEEVIAVLRSGWLGTGPRVSMFEKEFSDYKKVPHSIAVNSCTAALHLSLLTSGVGPGDEVITSALTFCATVNSIIHTGATPVIADIDPATLNIDPRDLEAKITERTKAIIPVHFAGRSCEMDALCAITKKYDLVMIEDCAHAIETEYKGRKAGTFGDTGCFSFYVTKNIITGEGGMVVTADDAHASRIKTLRLHGMSKDAWKRFSDEGYKHYDVVEAGYKYNMMDLQAAIGIHQLRRIEEYWAMREATWQKYNAAFSQMPLQLPTAPSVHERHAYHLYTVCVDPRNSRLSRDALLEHLTRNQIGAGVHYRCLAEYSYYQEKYGWRPEDVPNATQVGRTILSLPLSAKLTSDDVDDVVMAVRSGLVA